MKVQGNLFVAGETHGITFTDGVTPFNRAPKLSFDTNGFYLTPATDGNPIVNLKGLRASDGTNSYQQITNIGFSNSNFYLSGANTQKPTVNLRFPFVKAIALEFPGSAENIMIFRAHEAMRIVSARATLVGSSSPSVTFSVKSGSDRSNLTTTHTVSTAITSTTTGTLLGVSTAEIPAGSWVCLVSTAQSGTVSELDCSLQLEYA